MNRPLTRTDLMMLREENPETFYQLMPAMRIHVLPGKVSKVERASVSYEIVTKEGIPCPADDAVGTQVFNKWIIDVKMRIGSFVKSHEKFIVIAFRSFEDALYFFYCRSFEVELAQMGVEVSAPHCEGGNNETGSTKQIDQVQHVHVFLAECRELDELRRACSRDVEKYPGYADDGCELFTAEQFESLLNERVPIHAQECTR